jgi:acyl dehydratase
MREVTVGLALPPLTLNLTPTRIAAGALATRDFEPIHHDRTAAERVGRKDVFMNIFMLNGVMQRCITDWAGPEACIKTIRLRLSGASVAGEVLTIRGHVTAVSDSSVQIELQGGNGETTSAYASVMVSVPQ